MNLFNKSSHFTLSSFNNLNKKNIAIHLVKILFHLWEMNTIALPYYLLLILNFNQIFNTICR